MATKPALNDYAIMDHLIHDKLSSGEEVILLPITRYDNILGSPKVVTDLNEFIAAPFFLYVKDEVEMDAETLGLMIGVSFDTHLKTII